MHDKWFGGYGKLKGQFSWPTALTLDKDGNVYVGDSGNYRIQKFDKNGLALDEFANGVKDVVEDIVGKSWVGKDSQKTNCPEEPPNFCFSGLLFGEMFIGQ